MSDDKIPPSMVDATMHAIRLHAPGGPGSLVYEEMQTPRPGAGEALVRVYAAAITRGELDWPVDRLPAVPSYEFSGKVAALGPDVAGIEVGQAVYSLSGFDRDGAAAEYVALPASFLARKPRTLGFIESAAIPLAALSAWQGLFDHGNLQKGELVLILGAAGGVGSYAVQLARQRGAHVIGTASTTNMGIVRELGADEVMDHMAVTERVDLVFDTVGGERLRQAPAALRAGGRLVSVAEEPPQQEKLTAIYFVVKPSREQLEQITRLVESGELRPTIDQVYPLAEAQRAFERSLGAHGAGKVVLRVREEDV